MASYWEEVIADSPTVLLKMDEASGDIVDAQVGNNGTVSGSGATYRATGPDAIGIPYALTFTSSTILTVTTSTDLDLADGPFSIELWVKKAVAATQYCIFLKGDNSSTNGCQIWNSTANNIKLAQGEGTVHLNSTADSDVSGFHHWVFTRASPTVANGTIYRDGSTYLSSNTGRTFANSTSNLILGLSAGGSFAGSLAGLAIYKSELSSGRVAAHYAARSTAAAAATASSGMLGFFG